MAVSEINQELIIEILSKLKSVQTFRWRDTTQGQNYWENVCKNLRLIAGNISLSDYEIQAGKREDVADLLELAFSWENTGGSHKYWSSVVECLRYPETIPHDPYYAVNLSSKEVYKKIVTHTEGFL